MVGVSSVAELPVCYVFCTTIKRRFSGAGNTGAIGGTLGPASPSDPALKLSRTQIFEHRYPRLSFLTACHFRSA